MARPSKLNEELIEKIYSELKEGLPVIYVCGLFGVLERSFYQWMNRGEEDFGNENETIYALFFQTIKKGQAEFVQTANKDIRSGRAGWQGTAWWLERTHQDFMPKQEIKAGDDGKVTVVLGGSKVKDIKKNDYDK